ncbi:MAG TPA: (d)CMP kinase, partial [Cystobacter sp.]
LFQKGVERALPDVLADQVKRDQDDASRAVAPLKPADDARRVDSSLLPLSEVVRTLEQEILARMARR